MTDIRRDVSLSVVVRIDRTGNWVEWSTGHRSVPEVLAEAEPLAALPAVAAIRFDRITRTTERLSLHDLVDEAQRPADPVASTAPLAAGLPHVRGRCPACGTAALFLGDGGYVTCSVRDCPEPDAASTVLEPRAASRMAAEAQPPTACSSPPCDAEAGDPCARHEREQATSANIDLGFVLALARRLAPDVIVNGRTAAEVWRRTPPESRPAAPGCGS